VSARCRCHCGGWWSGADSNGDSAAIQRHQISLVIFDELFRGITTSNSRVTARRSIESPFAAFGLTLIAFALNDSRSRGHPRGIRRSCVTTHVLELSQVRRSILGDYLP